MEELPIIREHVETLVVLVQDLLYYAAAIYWTTGITAGLCLMLVVARAFIVKRPIS